MEQAINVALPRRTVFDPLALSPNDGTIAFYDPINDALQANHHVLNFGAGRGADVIDDACVARRRMRTFKGRCAHVSGCDIDPIVMSNPLLDEARVLHRGSLPYQDCCFDLIVADHVFEHVEHPAGVAAELLRVMKPAGRLFARTPNRLGYIAVAARLIPDTVVRRAQPGRSLDDVYPKFYRMNTVGDLSRLFDGADVRVQTHSPEPSYHFGSRVLSAAMSFAQAITPAALQPVLHVEVRKHHD